MQTKTNKNLILKFYITSQDMNKIQIVEIHNETKNTLHFSHNCMQGEKRERDRQTDRQKERERGKIWDCTERDNMREKER